ncbi:MAG: hypothetical protein IT376_19090 [Polyangiaceae bacterium]|nr:hypothetical protein [Polyangiaceae bacterium]
MRLVNARSSPIYLGGGYGCSDPMLYELRGPAPADEALRLQLGACGYTCEDLQEHAGGCLAECMIPPTTKISAGGHRDLVWQMTSAVGVQMPAACYADPSTSEGSCDRLLVPAPGTYLASATARAALLCADVGLCDCEVDADGACELWDPAQPDGEALGATTSFAFPSETTIVLTFHE